MLNVGIIRVMREGGETARGERLDIDCEPDLYGQEPDGRALCCELCLLGAWAGACVRAGTGAGAG